MKRLLLSNKARKTLRGSSSGITLIEVLVALALFAIIGIAFASGLGTASRATFTADVRTNAESLARTQMEYVKSCNYTDANGGFATYPKIDMSSFPSYAICSVNANNETVNCEYIDPIIAIPWDTETDAPLPIEDGDKGLQRIKLVIKHEGRVVISLEGYKLNR